GHEPARVVQERVQVARRTSVREVVDARVGVVLADLVSGDPVSRGAQRRHQSGCDSRLTLPGAGCGDHHAGGRCGRYHSMPRCPFCPESMGCFTLPMSTTRSAADTKASGARLPAITTCWRPGREFSVSTTLS